ncbi:MAG: hypothetical protein ABS36_16985 [Acidobacteria bacterium SCN 69-37]|nr:MAG: hypothetical protein ABS36_16985 [Acidobacteria bacterium SCN 69-37]
MSTYTSRALPTETDVLAAVCLLLVHVPGHRPTAADVAAFFGYRERGFRKLWKNATREPLKSLIPFACGLRAAWLVNVEHEKGLSAAIAAGQTNPSNVNRQLKRRLGITLRDCRDRLPQGFDWNRLRVACIDLETRRHRAEAPHG